MLKLINNLKIIILLCLTLGLAPYFPEPHLIGKLRWMAGGAHNMKAIDFLDIVIHGTPFILLIRIIYIKTLSNFKNNSKI